MAASTNEVDVILNRANVALAKSQRLIASWLPPRTDEEIARAKSGAEIEHEEQEIFAPIPELLGLGATIPQDPNDGSSRQFSSHNKTLRKKLLGKASQTRRPSTRETYVTGHTNIKLSQMNSRSDLADEDDEDSRSALGKSKREKGDKPGENADLSKSQEDREGAMNAKRKGGRSYLDEVLSTRSPKRKRRKASTTDAPS